MADSVFFLRDYLDINHEVGTAFGKFVEEFIEVVVRVKQMDNYLNEAIV